MIELSNITRTFPARGRAASPAVILQGVSMHIPPGAYASLTGASGSGKSTLMNILGCLDRASSGTYRLHGRDVSSLSPKELAAVRGEEIGFVFQGFQLIPRLTALENVMLPLMLCGVPLATRRETAEQLLERVGLAEKMQHYPAALSGGQQQRVAIARALVRRPALILADEPTGSLDPQSAREVMELMEELNRAGQTILMITHDPALAARATRRYQLLDGRVMEK